MVIDMVARGSIFLGHCLLFYAHLITFEVGEIKLVNIYIQVDGTNHMIKEKQN